MKIELIRGSHSITETNMHLQITPAFRQDIFEDEIMRILVRDYMLAQLIVLKRLEPPKFERFEEVMKKGMKFAKKKGLRSGNVEKAIAEYRKEKRR